ncbi:hypothetical protein AAMO2058_000825400 [Amorphochlora amoebiformis]
MAQNGADECEDTAWERAEKFFLQFFGFETVLRNESEIKNLLETSSNPTVWASIGRRWRNLEIIGDIRSVTPMYGLVENIKEPGPNEHEIEHIKYNRRVDRVYMLYPELLTKEKPSCMSSLQPCYQWHHKRRMQMLLKYPQLRELMKPDQKPAYNLWLFALLAFHMMLAALCGYVRRSCESSLSSLVFVVAAAGVLGAGFAFNLQQLTHEVSHNVLWPKTITHALMFLADLTFGICGPGWHGYYMMLHSQHHRNAGGRDDPDVSFQMYWSVIPKGLSTSRIGRVVWLTVFGLFTQAVVLFCHCCGVNKLNFLMEHKVSLATVLAAKLGYWSACYFLLGGGSVLYLWLASGFALGAFAHPYVGFWLIQHLSIPGNGHQPTVSYGGSDWWHLANFGALRHVEHHDFPTVPFTTCHRIRKIAPDFYDHLYEVPSILGITWEWICHTDGTAWMDFAGNQRFVVSQAELPVISKRRPRLLDSLLKPLNEHAKKLMQPADQYRAVSTSEEEENPKSEEKK